MRRIVSVVAVSLVFALGSFAGVARASCVPPRPIPEEIEDAPAVFVGTVSEVENEGRWATVDVAEVWKGDVEPEVEVRGGPKDPPGPMSTITSVDRSYKSGKTYLFVPYKGSGSVFRDNICTRTSVYRSAFDRFRPASAETTRPPSDTRAPENASSVWVFVLVGVGGVVVALVVARALRSRAGTSDY